MFKEAEVVMRAGDALRLTKGRSAENKLHSVNQAQVWDKGVDGNAALMMVRLPALHHCTRVISLHLFLVGSGFDLLGGGRKQWQISRRSCFKKTPSDGLSRTKSSEQGVDLFA